MSLSCCLLNSNFGIFAAMKAEIINIGDELLIGQVVNTNASWMAEQLTLTGFPVIRVTVINDTRDQVLNALKEAEDRSDIVLISGGIGPTSDDITKQTLCEYFNTSLVFDEDAYRDIELFFALRGMKVTPLNRQQAELPAACISLPNKLGTARGMWFEKRDSSGRKVVFVSLPGVPFEMKELMVKEVIPRLKKHFNPPFLYHKTLLTQGIGESFLAEQIARWEENLPENIRLAYLPQPGLVRLRLSGSGDNETTVRRQVTTAAEELQSLIPDYLFGQDNDTLEAIIGLLLTEKGQTLATAESCTGGYIAHLITSVPGSSNYFKGSIVAYSNDIKENLLFVSPETILKKGAVSEETVLEMAVAVQTQLAADYAIATTGIAGPDGGTALKPVGTVWIGIATPGEVFARQYLFGDNRERNIRKAALQALNLLRKSLL